MQILFQLPASILTNKLQSLHHTAPHCTTLHHTAPHCTTLHHTATHCNALQHILINHVIQSLPAKSDYRQALLLASKETEKQYQLFLAGNANTWGGVVDDCHGPISFSDFCLLIDLDASEKAIGWDSQKSLSYLICYVH